MEQKNDYNINSLIRSLNILEYLVDNGEVSILEMSNSFGMGKSTVHRILGTFKTMGYVDQNKENNKYYATLKIFELGNKVANRIPLKKIVRPYLEELFEKCHETVNFAIVDKNEVVFLDKIITAEPLRIELEVGKRVPVHCSALGKAFIAFKRDLDISQLKLTKINNNTIDSAEKLMSNLEEIRRNGYALDDGEYIEGLICIAVPIKDQLNNAIAVISIATPAVRMEEEKKQIYVRLLQETALRISMHSGFVSN
ncbi:IclR family transcriptional regulator [Clostridium sp. CX1]|uniref:IclR family transcriptional regulator n=1 Tax=Clostridium tanneri TaxID=3037988 RepID=A0ABU4JQ83_9CLOT|nr:MULTISPECIES: IclR family transcriptional regulator [unclassified Clostridium]MCT8978779.1 IclR family transcriptional regulator [Clostridium sp. CX1]MDW8800290.1 IclR family transcriptional regulator [Clostridium sp. A1-XYC3]